jgi:plastocyanin
MDVRVVALALALSIFGSPAVAGTIRGVLRASAPPPASSMPGNAYPGRANSMALTHELIRGLVTDAVVFVEKVPAAVDSTLPMPSGPHALAQKGQMFVPRVVAIPAGGSVDFPNEDPIYHNVFSPSPARRFDLGKYPRGQSRRVFFPRHGVINVFCDIHSNMEAFILVLPHRAFARPDADGRFELPPLPPGQYVLRAWHPDFREIQRDVTVPEDGDVSADLSF